MNLEETAPYFRWPTRFPEFGVGIFESFYFTWEVNALSVLWQGPEAPAVLKGGISRRGSFVIIECGDIYVLHRDFKIKFPEDGE